MVLGTKILMTAVLFNEIIEQNNVQMLTSKLQMVNIMEITSIMFL